MTVGVGGSTGEDETQLAGGGGGGASTVTLGTADAPVIVAAGDGGAVYSYHIAV